MDMPQFPGFEAPDAEGMYRVSTTTDLAPLFETGPVALGRRAHAYLSEASQTVEEVLFRHVRGTLPGPAEKNAKALRQGGNIMSECSTFVGMRIIISTYWSPDTAETCTFVTTPSEAKEICMALAGGAR